MRIAFYKRKDTIFDKIVQKFTFGPYSHVELVVKGVGYSSLPSVGVYKRIHDYDTETWDYVVVNGLCEAIIHKFYHKTKEDKYDYFALLSAIIPVTTPTNRWDCVEWVGTALKISGCEKLWKYVPSRLSPNSLYRILTGE